MQSFGFVIMSLAEISRTLEMNYEGISKFWESCGNLVKRFVKLIGRFFIFIKDSIVKLFIFLKNWIV
jgi:hypothetical protein